MPDPEAVPSAAELRRCLHNASVLLAATDLRVSAEQHEHVLRLAQHWVRKVLTGIDQLWRLAEAVPGTVDEPLTGPIEQVTIRIER